MNEHVVVLLNLGVLVVGLLKKQVGEVFEVALVTYFEKLNEVFLWTVDLNPALDTEYVLNKFSVLKQHLLLLFEFLLLSLGHLGLDLLALLLLLLDFLDIKVGLCRLFLQYFEVLLAELVEFLMNKLGQRELNVIKVLVQEIHVLDLVLRGVHRIVTRLEKALRVVKEGCPSLIGVYHTILLQVEYNKG